MKHIVANALLVAGFCLGTLGSAGFNQVDKTTEPNAYAYLGVGLLLIVIGGLVLRAARRSHASTSRSEATGLAWFQRSIDAIRDQVAALEENRDARAVHQRIGELLGGDFFDLTSRHEELVRLVGFGRYAEVWDGVAGTERLLARAWSMITDGYDEQGLAELPLARRHIESASSAVARL